MSVEGPSFDVGKSVLEEVSDKILIETLPTYADNFKKEHDITPTIQIMKNGVSLEIYGNTYPHKETIKKHGFIWSGGRWQKWYPIYNKNKEQIKHIYDALLEAIEEGLAILIEVTE